MDLPVSLTVEEKVNVTATPKSLSGVTAPVDGNLVWVVENPNIVTLEVSTDGFSAFIVAKAIGSTVVTVTGDADLSTGVRSINGRVLVTVTHAEATSIEFVADAPVQK